MTIEQALGRIADSLEILSGQVAPVERDGEPEVEEPEPPKKAKAKAKAKKENVPDPEPDDGGGDDPTEDSCRDAIRELMTDHGKDAAFEVLGQYECEKVSDLEKSQYAPFITDCEGYESAEPDPEG